MRTSTACAERTVTCMTRRRSGVVYLASIEKVGVPKEGISPYLLAYRIRDDSILRYLQERDRCRPISLFRIQVYIHKNLIFWHSKNEHQYISTSSQTPSIHPSTYCPSVVIHTFTTHSPPSQHCRRRHHLTTSYASCVPAINYGCLSCQNVDSATSAFGCGLWTIENTVFLVLVIWLH